MIIFDLDGTLADCEHRRHFVDPEKDLHYLRELEEIDSHGVPTTDKFTWCHMDTGKKWKPDWKSFFEACDKDEPIINTIGVFRALWAMPKSCEMEIWSGRCESVRKKTEDWLLKYGCLKCRLRMRPIGDSTPDDVLKERWLDELLASGKTVDMVFDDRPKVVRMWQRRGIFTFDVSQGKGEF